MSIRIDNKKFKADLQRFIKKNHSGCVRAIKISTMKMKESAKRKVQQHIRGSKSVTGNLMNGIDYGISNRGLTGEVISNADYSEAFEEGQRPHTIRITHKQVLAGPFRARPSGWGVSKKSKGMGFATYGKKVQHPGTHPRPFMRPAFQMGQRTLESELKKIFK